MAYEEGTKPTLITVEGKQEEYEAALKSYREQSAGIIDEIAQRQLVLDGVNQAIEKRQKDLNDWLSKKVEDLNTNIEVLISAVDQKTAASNALDLEIADRIVKRDAIVLDVTTREKAIVDQTTSLKVWEDRLKVMQKNLDTNSIEFNRKHTDIETVQSAKDSELSNRENEIDNQMDHLQSWEFELVSREEAVKNSQEQLDKTLEEITNRRLEIQKSLDDAQPILDQAAAVQVQLDSIQARIDIANVQEQKNQEDANQIIVMKQAIANDRAELNSRQAALTAAEAKHVGG